MAVPRCPKASAIGRITRGGRPVTRTTRPPPPPPRANAATVRGEIVPSLRMIVPSRSVATSNGYAATTTEPNRADRVPRPGQAYRSADAAGPELDADARARRARGLGHGVLPGALATAAHHEQVPVPEDVALGFPATARAQQQRPGLTERQDRDHRVLGGAAPDGVTMPGDAVPAVPVEAQSRRHERLAELARVVRVQRVAARVQGRVWQR